jgi:peptide-methionine (S)-S-oxide reductase
VKERSLIAMLFVAMLAMTGCMKNGSSSTAESAKTTSESTTAMPVNDPRYRLATFAGGCFWCIETIFDELKGVDKVVSGYSGGKTENPTYEEVCSGRTGHAEVIEITFDPAVISYKQLVEIFFYVHDPTTMNQQGADKGTQYRSAIFYHSDEQKKIAEEVIKETEASGLWDDPIVTEVTMFDKFYSAEDYHQDYYVNNKEKSYCSIVIAPKVQKFYKKYQHLLKD